MQQTSLKSTKVFLIYSQFECHNFSLWESAKVFFINGSLIQEMREKNLVITV